MTHSPDSFHDVEGIAVGMSSVERGLVVESCCIHDERVPLPPPNRISHPRGDQVLGMFPPVGVNLPYQVLKFVVNQHSARQRNDFEPMRLRPDTWHARRKAEHDGFHLLLTGLELLFSPREKGSASFEPEIAPHFTLREPDSRNIRGLA